MATIRRNAHKKIAKLAKGALRATAHNHSSPEPSREIDPAHLDAVLEDWFEWTRKGCGSAGVYEGTRYCPEDRSKVVPVKVMTLWYHQNRTIDFVLEQGEPREAR